MKQISTKTGDLGQTSLRGGIRVEKDDLRIETNGQIDMLNSLLGLLRTCLSSPVPLLVDIQHELMTLMSHVATPDDQQNPRPLHADGLTLRMEQAISEATPPKGFVTPGDNGQPSALAHVARAQARAVERRLWTLHRQHPLDEGVMRMMNRLSDYLFVLATNETSITLKETTSIGK